MLLINCFKQNAENELIDPALTCKIIHF